MNKGSHRVLVHLLALLLSSTWGLAVAANPSWQWRPVQPGKRKGISGLAWVQQQDDICQFLAVHDNKGDAEQPRIALMKVPAHGPVQYQSLSWPQADDLPLDLEALTVVPNTNRTEYVAVTSLGQVYHLRLDLPTKTLTVLHTLQISLSSLPINIEGFALQRIKDQLIAVWADRGEDSKPGMLFWGTYNPKQSEMVATGSTPLQVPWPSSQVRHISDLKVDPGGLLYITAASDPGDLGPFQSAMYVAGSFHFSASIPGRNGELKFAGPADLVPLYRFKFNKVEALELIPGKNGSILLASDDERFGSALAGQCHTTPE